MKTPPHFLLHNAALLGVLIFGLIFTASCSVNPERLPPTETIDISTEIITEQDPTLTPIEIEQIESTPSQVEGDLPELEQPQNIQYDIQVVLDYFNHQLQIKQTIQIPHPGLTPLDQINLVVPPNAWPNAIIFNQVSLGSDKPVENYQLNGVRLTVPLSQTWMPGEGQELFLDYRLNLPVQNAREGFGPSPFGYTELQTNLVDWYPMVPPYQEGEGWIIHDPWIFGEYLVYPAADFQVSLEIINSPELVVAASSISQQEQGIRFYELDHARNFVFSISPDYQVLEAQVDGVKVYGYVFSPYLVPGQAAFNTTIEALRHYSELYGPYNQPSLSMIQADFNHGMEYEGLYFQSRGFFDTYAGTQESYLITIAAHETAHQWWYGQVANDQALEPWLDEALCTFSELVYYERVHPESVDWWWATRVNYYLPSGVIDRSIYDFQEFSDQYLTYRNATYLQGAKFVVQLRDDMGEDAFYYFLREYAARYQNQVINREDFFSLLGEYIDTQKLSWLGEYFRE